MMLRNKISSVTTKSDNLESRVLLASATAGSSVQISGFNVLDPQGFAYNFANVSLFAEAKGKNSQAVANAAVESVGRLLTNEQYGYKARLTAAKTTGDLEQIVSDARNQVASLFPDHLKQLTAQLVLGI